MTGFVSDGPIVENPIGAAERDYAQMPEPFGERFVRSTLEGGPTEYLARWLQRGVAGQPGVSGALARGLTEEAGFEGGMSPEEMGLTAEGEAEPSPELSAKEINDKLAPLGPDGQRVKLTGAPMPQALAEVVAKQKADQITRDGVLARFANSHGVLTNFAAGAAVSLLDPLNAASTLIPGIGEETLAERLGGGWLARVAGHAAAGATGAAAGQLPLTAMRYALAPEEADDYSLRDAFRDLAFNAAGGAILQAGFGAAGELLRGHLQAARILAAPAPVKADALRAAVSEISSGRPVEVRPVVREAPAPLPPQPVSLAEFIARSGGLRDEGGDLRAIDAQKWHREAPFRPRLVRPDGMSLDAARELAQQHGYLPPDAAHLPPTEGTNEFLARLTDDINGKRIYSENDRLAVEQHAQHAATERQTDADRLEHERYTLQRRAFDLGIAVDPDWSPEDLSAAVEEREAMMAEGSLADVAEDQERLYRDGFAPGLAQGDFDAAYQPVYGPKEAPEAAAPPTAKGAGGEVGQPQHEAAAAEARAPGEAAAPEDREMAEAEAALPEAARATLSPEERAELDAADKGMAEAEKDAASYGEAAACLREAAE
jgi:hypothetical protein